MASVGRVALASRDAAVQPVDAKATARTSMARQSVKPNGWWGNERRGVSWFDFADMDAVYTQRPSSPRDGAAGKARGIVVLGGGSTPVSERTREDPDRPAPLARTVPRLYST